MHYGQKDKKIYNLYMIHIYICYLYVILYLFYLE